MKNDSKKKKAVKKIAEQTDGLKKPVSGLMSDTRKDASHVGQKSAEAADKAGKKMEKAGKDMKASLQETRKDLKTSMKKADQKAHK